MGAIALLGALVCVSPAVAQDDTPQSAPLVMNWRTVTWDPPAPNRPRFPTGLQNAQITIDPGTGSPTYLARFPARSRFEMHWHTYTETAVVMEGTVDIVLDGTRHTAARAATSSFPARRTTPGSCRRTAMSFCSRVGTGPPIFISSNRRAGNVGTKPAVFAIV